MVSVSGIWLQTCKTSGTMNVISFHIMIRLIPYSLNTSYLTRMIVQNANSDQF